MGVIYKFKAEVLNFALQQKQADPNLSCRQLADIISKKFNLQVSKSSVNSILKNAALSSPVGRRALSVAKAKAFQIPSIKKKEIFGGPSINAEKVEPKNEASFNARTSTENTIQRNIHVRSSSEAMPKLPSGPAHVEAKASAQHRHASPASDTHRHDGLGNIFFKAVEWSLSSKPILGDILKDHVKGYSVDDIYAASKVLPCLHAFGVMSIDALAQYKGTGLWRLNQLSEGFDFRIIKTLYDSLLNLDEIGFRFANELEQLFTEISYFKIICEDGQELAIDALWENILHNNVQSDCRILYNHLLSNLTEQIISPRIPTLIKKAPGQTTISREFYDLLAIFECRPGKAITAISLTDTNGVELSRFCSVPAQPRNFITAVGPWQKEFDYLSSHALNSHKEELINPLTSQGAHYAEINRQAILEFTRHVSPSIRAYLVTLADKKASKCILITNMTKEHMSTKDIILSYWMRWSHWQNMDSKPNLGNDANVSSASIVPSANLWENINIYARKIEEYAYRQFIGLNSNISINDFISMCYKTSGYWHDDGNYSIISLIPPDDITVEKVRILQDAAGQFNRSSIADHAGKRVFLKIAQTS